MQHMFGSNKELRPQSLSVPMYTNHFGPNVALVCRPALSSRVLGPVCRLLPLGLVGRLAKRHPSRSHRLEGAHRGAPQPGALGGTRRRGCRGPVKLYCFGIMFYFYFSIQSFATTRLPPLVCHYSFATTRFALNLACQYSCVCK